MFNKLLLSLILFLLKFNFSKLVYNSCFVVKNIFLLMYKNNSFQLLIIYNEKC